MTTSQPDTDRPNKPRLSRTTGALLVLTVIMSVSALMSAAVFGWGTSLGAVWFRLAPESLGLAQAGVQRHLWPPLWDPGAQWVLTKPVWAAPFTAAVLCGFIAGVRRVFGRSNKAAVGTESKW